MVVLAKVKKLTGSRFLHYSVRSAASSAASSVSSGVNAAAAATTSAPSGAAYKGATAGFGLLAAGVLFALAA